MPSSTRIADIRIDIAAVSEGVAARASADDESIAVGVIDGDRRDLTVIGASSDTDRRGDEDLLALVGRLTSAGVVDTTFASSGFFTNSFSSFASNVNDVGFDSKGRVVIGGSWAQTNPDYGAARLFP